VQAMSIGRERWATVVASALTFASTAGLVAGCGVSTRNQGPGNVRLVAALTPHASRQTSYRDPAGWSVRYPRTLRLERSHNLYDTVTTEVTIANFAASAGVLQTRSGFRVTPPIAPSGSFPRNGIAFRIVDFDYGGAQSIPNSLLPITLSSFRPSRARRGTRLPHGGAAYNALDGETVARFHYRGVPTSVHREIHAHGHIYEAIAWIGHDASAGLRARLERLIESFRFRTPKLGPSQPSGAY
jgi:hypothetical protein